RRRREASRPARTRPDPHGRAAGTDSTARRPRDTKRGCAPEIRRLPNAVRDFDGWPSPASSPGSLFLDPSEIGAVSRFRKRSLVLAVAKQLVEQDGAERGRADATEREAAELERQVAGADRQRHRRGDEVARAREIDLV